MKTPNQTDSRGRVEQAVNRALCSLKHLAEIVGRTEAGRAGLGWGTAPRFWMVNHRYLYTWIYRSDLTTSTGGQGDYSVLCPINKLDSNKHITLQEVNVQSLSDIAELIHDYILDKGIDTRCLGEIWQQPGAALL